MSLSNLITSATDVKITDYPSSGGKNLSLFKKKNNVTYLQLSISLYRICCQEEIRVTLTGDHGPVGIVVVGTVK